MGYSDAYLIGVIIQESLLLAVWALYQGFVLDWTLRPCSVRDAFTGWDETKSRDIGAGIDHYHVGRSDRHESYERWSCWHF